MRIDLILSLAVRNRDGGMELFQLGSPSVCGNAPAASVAFAVGCAFWARFRVSRRNLNRARRHLRGLGRFKAHSMTEPRPCEAGAPQGARSDYEDSPA